MFLTCEIALYSKLVLKCVKSASMAPFSPSCFDVLPQWIISELACYTYSMVVVPLYDTLGPGAIRYIVNTGKNKIVIIISETSFVAQNGSFSSVFQKTGEFTRWVSRSHSERFLGSVCPQAGSGLALLHFSCARLCVAVDGAALVGGITPGPPTPVLLHILPPRFFSPHGEQFYLVFWTESQNNCRCHYSFGIGLS